MKEKNLYIQKIKGIMILFVILTHCLLIMQSMAPQIVIIVLKRSIYFATPCFFFISALYIKEEKGIEIWRKKWKRIIPPFIIWTLMDQFSYLLWRKQPFPNPHLYYLVALIQLFLLTPVLLEHINHSKNKWSLYAPFMISIIYDFIIFIVSILAGTALPYIEYFFFPWLGFYYLGLLFNKEKITFSWKKTTSLLLWLGTMIISITLGVLLYIHYHFVFLDQQQSVSVCIYSLLFCIFIKQSERKTKESILTKLGDISFGIYLSHFFILKLLFYILPQTNNVWINIILLWIVTIILSYIVNTIYYKIKKRIA